MSDSRLPQATAAVPYDSADRDGSGSMDGDITVLAGTQLNIKDDVKDGVKDEENPKEETDPVGGISTNAASMLRVLLPSLTKLDGLLESVWTKQDSLNGVLNRLASELEQFDELIVPPDMDTTNSSHAMLSSAGVNDRPVGLLSASKEAAQKLRESRTRVANINVTLKRVRARLDSVSLLAQAKILQNQQDLQKYSGGERGRGEGGESHVL